MYLKVTVDTTILVPIGQKKISWDQILNVFIEGKPLEVFVTSAAMQEFHKSKAYPERIKVLDDLKSYRAGFGSGLFGQGLYGGAVVHQAKFASSLFTVGHSEIGSGDGIGSEEDIKNLDQILRLLTNGASSGWNWQELKPGQLSQYRDAQAFEAHVRYQNDIFLTNDADFNKLKKDYSTRIMNFDEFQSIVSNGISHEAGGIIGGR